MGTNELSLPLLRVALTNSREHALSRPRRIGGRGALVSILGLSPREESAILSPASTFVTLRNIPLLRSLLPLPLAAGGANNRKLKGKLTGTFDPTVLYTGIVAVVAAAMGVGALLWFGFFSARKAKKGLNAAS